MWRKRMSATFANNMMKFSNNAPEKSAPSKEERPIPVKPEPARAAFTLPPGAAFTLPPGAADAAPPGYLPTRYVPNSPVQARPDPARRDPSLTSPTAFPVPHPARLPERPIPVRPEPARRGPSLTLPQGAGQPILPMAFPVPHPANPHADIRQSGPSASAFARQNVAPSGRKPAAATVSFPEPRVGGVTVKQTGALRDSRDSVGIFTVEKITSRPTPVRLEDKVIDKPATSRIPQVTKPHETSVAGPPPVPRKDKRRHARSGSNGPYEVNRQAPMRHSRSGSNPLVEVIPEGSGSNLVEIIPEVGVPIIPVAQNNRTPKKIEVPKTNKKYLEYTNEVLVDQAIKCKECRKNGRCKACRQSEDLNVYFGSMFR